MMQRRNDRLPLAGEKINKEIAGRPYQEQAIRSVTESMEKENRRRNLLVMATGTGKTRVAIALSDLLMHCNWVKRVLFLADRRPLVKQATAAFTNHLPNIGVVNLLTNPDSQGRIYVSTYQTILNQINKTDGEKRKFGIGHFDLVIIDEAHRSVYNRYRSIFNYFDSYLLGLTATPRDEIDRNTYSLFQTETGMPTYAYGLEEAISQGFLSPPRAVSVGRRRSP
jgi:type I restriction enzyme R subunit